MRFNRYGFHCLTFKEHPAEYAAGAGKQSVIKTCTSADSAAIRGKSDPGDEPEDIFGIDVFTDAPSWFRESESACLPWRRSIPAGVCHFVCVAVPAGENKSAVKNTAQVRFI